MPFLGIPFFIIGLRQSGTLEAKFDDTVGDFFVNLRIYLTFFILKKKTKLLNVVGR